MLFLLFLPLLQRQELRTKLFAGEPSPSTNGWRESCCGVDACAHASRRCGCRTRRALDYYNKTRALQVVYPAGIQQEYRVGTHVRLDHSGVRGHIRPIVRKQLLDPSVSLQHVSELPRSAPGNRPSVAVGLFRLWRGRHAGRSGRGPALVSFPPSALLARHHQQRRRVVPLPSRSVAGREHRSAAAAPSAGCA